MNKFIILVVGLMLLMGLPRSLALSVYGAQSFPPAPSVSQAAVGRIAQHQTQIENYTFTSRDGRTIRIFYSLPVARNNDTRILFVMHGMGRNAYNAINNFRYLAETRNIILVAPEFTEEQFPVRDYQFLGITRNIDTPRNWTSVTIDDIFIDFVNRFRLPNRRYILFGHSAGAQFTHRAVIYSQSNYLDFAIAANAGQFTFLDDQFNHGSGGIRNTTPIHQNLINRNLGRRLYVLIGSNDNDPEEPSLPRAEHAMRQGAHRLERTLNFFQTSKAYAERHRLFFNWELIIMDGVAHSQRQTLPFVVDIITRR